MWVEVVGEWWEEHCCCVVLLVFFFFFQAEDGIRDSSVTGVQTCALPIFNRSPLDARFTVSEIVGSRLASGFGPTIGAGTASASATAKHSAAQSAPRALTRYVE